MNKPHIWFWFCKLLTIAKKEKKPSQCYFIPHLQFKCTLHLCTCACPGLLCIVTDAICDLCRSYLTKTLISQLLQVWLVTTHTCLLDLEMQSGATSISGTIGVISFCIPYFCAVVQSLLQSSFEGWDKTTLLKSPLCPSSALLSFPYVLFPSFKCATNTLVIQEFSSQALVQRYPFHQEWVWLEGGVVGTLFNVYRKYSKLSHLNLCSSILMT